MGMLVSVFLGASVRPCLVALVVIDPRRCIPTEVYAFGCFVGGLGSSQSVVPLVMCRSVTSGDPIVVAHERRSICFHR